MTLPNLDRFRLALVFHNGLGLAKGNGTLVSLGIPPDLGSGPVHQLEYIPEAGRQCVSMDRDDHARQMTLEETEAAHALLEHLTREFPRDSCRYDEPWKDGRC